MLILPPHHIGQTAELYAPRDFSWEITAPDGSVQTIDTPDKRVLIPLTMLGTYHYELSDGSEGDIDVIDAPAPSVAP